MNKNDYSFRVREALPEVVTGMEIGYANSRITRIESVIFINGDLFDKSSVEKITRIGV